MKVHRGNLQAKGKRFGIVVSRFNEFITKRLLESAVETLEQAGARPKNIEVVWVPGALEVPQFCKKLAISSSPHAFRRGSKIADSRLRSCGNDASKKKFHALVALACVLRGGTRHFECVTNEITRGISQVALETGVPIATGVITADTLEQAIDRAGLKSGNKGSQAALAAIEICDLSHRLNGRGKR